jgi:hypothetical protein
MVPSKKLTDCDKSYGGAEFTTIVFFVNNLILKRHF